MLSAAAVGSVDTQAVDLGGNLPAFAKQDAGEDSQTSYSHGGTNPVSSAGENDLAMIS